LCPAVQIMYIGDMLNIRVLPQELVNQIAAGEVIERPASVVKELIENSLDAGAGNIHVEMNGSGLELIRVSDDGSGMTEDELELAILRHATSKISTIDDLFSIKSLGFRGEALPSILSVSRAVISSRKADISHGTSLETEAGLVLRHLKKGMPAGTTIEVADLFFNTPARKKFMKTAATEQRHVMDILSRYALAYPAARFSLKINGRYLMSLISTSDFRERTAAVLGNLQARSLLPFRQERPGITIHGLVAPLTETRSNRNSIYTYVNGRSVKDSLIASAIMDGCSGLLMKGRYPVVVVFMEIDPPDVDVNVHPSKAEVRFRHPSAVFGLISATLGNAFSPPPPRYIHTREFPAMEVCHGIPSPYATKNSVHAEGSRDSSQEYSLFAVDPLSLHSEGFYSSKSIVGILHSTYLLLQDDQSLFILDQHAAHERVTFERLKASYGSESIRSQLLLTPVVLELSRQEYSVYLEIADDFRKLGIECEPFGDSTISVRSLPPMLNARDIKTFIRDVLTEQSEMLVKSRKAEANHEELMASIACHSSIRSGKLLSLSEAGALLKDLDSVGSPMTCPHGRPIFKKIDREEIERWIGRRP
jgi:DNA mismatch repair protein MutL